MAFKLFKKDNNSMGDVPELPNLDIPEPPQLDNSVPMDLPNMDIPEPPSLEPTTKEDMAMPNFDVPMDAPKIKPRPVPRREINDNDLPDFPNAEIVKDREVPEPPAFLSKMDDVKNDMVEGYIEHGTNIVNIHRPIFVEISDYKKVLRTIKSIEKDSKKSKDMAIELKEVKSKREKHLEGWDKKLENIQRSLIFTDKILFEEGGINV